MKLRILVLDDDKDIRDLLKTSLESRGHEVEAYADPTEFPFLKQGNCPCPPHEPCADVILADIVMPKVEGIDFLKKLKSAGCRPLVTGNVAIMSGYLTLHYMNDLNDMGIHYFRKPFSLEEISTWLEECCSRIGTSEASTTTH